MRLHADSMFTCPIPIHEAVTGAWVIEHLCLDALNRGSEMELPRYPGIVDWDNSFAHTCVGSIVIDSVFEP